MRPGPTVQRKAVRMIRRLAAPLQRADRAHGIEQRAFADVGGMGETHLAAMGRPGADALPHGKAALRHLAALQLPAAHGGALEEQFGDVRTAAREHAQRPADRRLVQPCRAEQARTGALDRAVAAVHALPPICIASIRIDPVRIAPRRSTS